MLNKQLNSELKETIKKEYEYIQSNKDAYIRMLEADKNVTLKNYANIRGLGKFMRNNEMLSNEQIETLIKQDATSFEFLNDFINTLEDAIDELRAKGPYPVSVMYRRKKYWESRLNKKC